jgi:hypothetical protein
VVEIFLMTFLMVILFTSFQYPSGITLKKIGLKNIPLKFGSVTAAASAFLPYRAITS